MNSYLVPVLSGALGALLGILSSLFTSALRHRQDIILRLVDQYFEVRKEIVNTVSELSDLNIKKPLEPKYRDSSVDAISKLFYKHYDFLPKPVLESLILLQVCLERSDGNLYKFSEGAIVLMEDADVVDFIEARAFFVNSKYVAALALKSRDTTTRTNQAIVLHARNVLLCLNEYVSVRDLAGMIKEFKKDISIGARFQPRRKGR